MPTVGATRAVAIAAIMIASIIVPSTAGAEESGTGFFSASSSSPLVPSTECDSSTWTGSGEFRLAGEDSSLFAHRRATLANTFEIELRSECGGAAAGDGTVSVRFFEHADTSLLYARQEVLKGSFDGTWSRLGLRLVAELIGDICTASTTYSLPDCDLEENGETLTIVATATASGLTGSLELGQRLEAPDSPLPELPTPLQEFAPTDSTMTPQEAQSDSTSSAAAVRSCNGYALYGPDGVISTRIFHLRGVRRLEFQYEAYSFHWGHRSNFDGTVLVNGYPIDNISPKYNVKSSYVFHKMVPDPYRLIGSFASKRLKGGNRVQFAVVQTFLSGKSPIYGHGTCVF